MIPSRPLDLGGIIGETIRIIKLVFSRSAVITFVCLLPGLLVFLVGMNEIDSSLERFTKVYTNAAPETSKLVRDYIALSVDTKPEMVIYRYQYPEIFAALDSVKISLATENPDSSREQIGSQLDSIRLLVKAQTGQPMSTSFLAIITPGLILLGIGLVLIVLGALGRMAAIFDLACRAFEDRPLILGPVFKLSMSRTLWLIVVQYLLISLAMLLGMGLLIGITAAISTVLGVLGVFASFGFIIYALFRIQFCSVALISEGLNPVAAIKRSLDLTAGQFWRVAGITIIVLLMITVVGVILGLPVSIMGRFSQDYIVEYLRTGIGLERVFGEFNSFIRMFIVGSSITGLLTAAFTPAFMTAFYYDLRTRLDGPLDYDTPPTHPEDTTPNPPEILAA